MLGLDFLASMSMVLCANDSTWYFAESPERKYSFISDGKSNDTCTDIRDLTVAQRQEINAVVDQVRELEPKGQQCTNVMTYEIKLTDYTPIKQKQYELNPKLLEVAHQEVDKMLEQGIIQPSTSDLCTPFIMVKKPDGSWRPCLDLRKLNSVILGDNYPIPNITTILNTLKGCKYVYFKI